jgi:hypothetical protein
LSLSLFSDRRLDFLTECMVATFRRWDTFLPFLELVVSFFQMSALGAASTDMLLSLPILLLLGVVVRVVGWLALGRRLGSHTVYLSH